MEKGCKREREDKMKDNGCLYDSETRTEDSAKGRTGEASKKERGRTGEASKMEGGSGGCRGNSPHLSLLPLSLAECSGNTVLPCQAPTLRLLLHR